MNFLLKKHPLSTILVIAIWIVCLVPIPQTPLDDVSFIDKWTHIIMYFALCAIIIIENIIAFRKKSGNRSYNGIFKSMICRHNIIISFLLPTAMGGLLEILQAYCTNGTRSGDWLDFLADGAGALLGNIICIPLVWFLSIKNKD